MAKARVVHSADAVLVEFKGDPRNPEPSTAVIRFPGGHVEVSRCSDGSYFAHVNVVDKANVVGSRLEFQDGAKHGITSIPQIPHGHLVNHIAIRIANNVPHLDIGD